jgi:hypothetical protein
MRPCQCRHELGISFAPLGSRPQPITKIRIDYGTVTISDGVIQAPSPTLTALLDALVATIPGFGSIPFALHENYNIARGIIEKIVVAIKCRPYRQAQSGNPENQFVRQIRLPR